MRRHRARFISFARRWTLSVGMATSPGSVLGSVRPFPPEGSVPLHGFRQAGPGIRDRDPDGVSLSSLTPVPASPVNRNPRQVTPIKVALPGTVP